MSHNTKLKAVSMALTDVRLTNKTNNMKLKKTKGKKYMHMIQGFLGIVDGLIRLVTFGCFWSNLQFTYVIKMLNKSTKTK